MARLLQIIGVVALLLAGAAGVWLAASTPERRDRALIELGLKRDALAVAEAGLETIQAQQYLAVLSARFLTKTTSRRELVEMLPDSIFTARKTLIVSGTVRYALDLAKLDAGDLRFDAATRTLTITAPPMLLLGPEFHVLAMDDIAEGQFAMWLSRSEQEMQKANWAESQAEIMRQARSPALIAQAGQEGDKALTRLFELPLRAAGFADVKVRVVRS